MRECLGVVAVLLVAAATADAQPVTQPQSDPQPQPQPQPQSQPQPQPQPQPYPAPQPYPTPPPYPAPQPYPPQPYPYPQPYPPQPVVVAPAQPEPPPRRPVAPMAVFLHALCPVDTEPACAGGIWVGYRNTSIQGPTDTVVGLGLDVSLGGSFGFGWEVGADIPQGERDGMAFATAVAEAAIGPGLRIGQFEIVPALGIGGEAVAWGSSDRDDDPYAEAYWYAILAGKVHADDLTLFATLTRKFEDRGKLDEIYADRVEVGAQWLTDKGPLGAGVWITDHPTHFTAGLAIFAPIEKKPKKKRGLF